MHGCWGACVVAKGWGHAWLGVGAVCGYQGGVWLLGACMVAGEVCGCWGVCMVAGEVCVVAGGVHGCRGGVWLQGRTCVGYDEIRSMSRQYASYWNAFLFILKFKFLEQSIDLPDRHPDCLSNQHSGIFQNCTQRYIYTLRCVLKISGRFHFLVRFYTIEWECTY